MRKSSSPILAAVLVVAVVALCAFALLRPMRSGRRPIGLRIVRPDGQPLPLEESGDHEIVLASGCGVERWSVKTGTDADRAKVSSVVVSSIASLSSRPKPSHYPTNNRVPPAELHVWQVTATVTQYKEEADSDIHLVLKDSANRSMIAEIPAPSCVGTTSRWPTNIAAARSIWIHTYPLSTLWHHINRSVTLRGLGFFDPPHGQTGASRNGIELHPVIRVQLK
jgi:hypothetical protein